MSVLDLLLSENENLLWHGTVSKEGLRWRLLYRVIFYIFLIIIMVSIPSIFFEFGELIYVGIVTAIIMISFWVFYYFIFRDASCYRELKNLEYYITDQKEFDLKRDKDIFNIYKIQCLYFNNIEKIIIHPLRITRKPIAHIEFYSEFIHENKEKVYYYIASGKSENPPVDRWRSSQDYEKHE